MLKSVFLSIIVILTSISAMAHGDHGAFEESQIERVLRVYEKAAALESDLVGQRGPAVPLIQLGGETIALDTPFWSLVADWIRIYHNEIQEDCHECRLPSVEESLKHVKDEVAKGFTRQVLVRPVNRAVEGMMIDSAQIGAELGRVAMVTKVAAEVAETVLSKVVGGGGVHALCTVFDAIILFGTRHIQTFYRVPSWGHAMGESRLKASLTQAFLASSVRRAQQRVSFELGPIILDAEALKVVDQEGPGRWWGWFSAGKRARWVTAIVKKTSAQYEKMQQLHEQRKQAQAGSRQAKET